MRIICTVFYHADSSMIMGYFQSSLILLLLPIEVEMLEVSIQPKGCICPSEGYTCQAKDSTLLNWYPTCNTTTGENLEFDVILLGTTVVERECGGFKVNYSAEHRRGHLPPITSTLLVTNLSVNGTDLTCEGTFKEMINNDTIPICVVGSASSPANVMVVWNLSSVMVSFQPPVYGAECVDYYTVTAISEERNVTCTVINDHHLNIFTCSFPDLNTTEYNFTVSPVTIGLNGTLYYGDFAVLVTTSDVVTDGTETASQEPDVPSAVVPDTPDTADKTIAVVTSFSVLLAVVAVFVLGSLVVLVVKRKQTSKQETVRGKEAGDNTDKDFLLGIKSQASIEDRRYDPPTSAPPAVPQAESPTGPPDVVPSHQVYADINTLTRKDKDKEGMEGETEEDKVKEREGEHIYHVLEGPTIVQTTAEHMNSVVDKSKKKKASALTTAEHVYSVVDKSKKRKKTSALPSPTLP